jgi:hypothetical protein
VGGCVKAVLVAIAVVAISLAAGPTALANPTDGLANRNDFRVRTLVANVNNGTSTIDAAGWLDRGLVANGYLIKVRPTFFVTQLCVNTADPTVRVTVATSFNAFTPEVHISVQQPSLTQVGVHLDWSTHVSFPNPVDPPGAEGYYNRCLSGYQPVNIGTTNPQFTVMSAQIDIWPSFNLITSPPPVKNGGLMLFDAVFPVGATVLKQGDAGGPP